MQPFQSLLVKWYITVTSDPLQSNEEYSHDPQALEVVSGSLGPEGEFHVISYGLNKLGGHATNMNG